MAHTMDGQLKVTRGQFLGLKKSREPEREWEQKNVIQI